MQSPRPCSPQLLSHCPQTPWGQSPRATSERGFPSASPEHVSEIQIPRSHLLHLGTCGNAKGGAARPVTPGHTEGGAPQSRGVCSCPLTLSPLPAHKHAPPGPRWPLVCLHVVPQTCPFRSAPTAYESGASCGLPGPSLTNRDPLSLSFPL